MKTNLFQRSFFLFFLCTFSFNLFAQRTPPQPFVYSQKLKSAALLFVENKGQITNAEGSPEPQVLFTANSGGAKIFLTATSLHYQFNRAVYPTNNSITSHDAIQKPSEQSTHRFTIQLQGANPQPQVQVEQPDAYTENYFLQHCPGGITYVHSYEKVVLKNVYPHIDWVLYSKGGFMEYDFLVHPGGNPAAIRLQVKDAENTTLTTAGELLMQTSLGEVREKAPVSYADGRLIPSHFMQYSDGSIGFAVQAPTGKELRIDPSVVWATYYGGSGIDYGYACATDASGNVYLAGTTTSAVGIASSGFQNTYAGGTYNGDAFLVKFNSSGTRLWATYYGGAGEDNTRTCVVDAGGNVYLAGITTSTSGIAAGGFQNTHNDGGAYNDAFLAKFSSDGTRQWATYYGGDSEDNLQSCAADPDGNVYLAGYTTSTANIAADGFQTTYNGGHDAFLVKLNGSGSRLWATYYGGSGYDLGASCAADASGNVYLAGRTNSTADIASSGFQNTHADGGSFSDAYLVKFSNTGSRLWATYYGGGNYDYGYFCATDGSGNAYLVGQTSSPNGIAFNGYQNTYSGNYADAFLAKFAGDGTRQWATYYGGSSFGASASASTTDASGNVYLSGYTSSAAGIASGGFQNTYGGGNTDAYLVKFSSAGSRLWATYYGGSGQEGVGICKVDVNGYLYLSGSTRSGDNIAMGGFQNTYAGAGDAFLVKVDVGSIILPVTLTSLSAYTQGTTIVVNWQVQQERGIKSYMIEKSADGATFTKVGEQLATGNTTYSWQDNNSGEGAHFYRLKITSADGKITYSTIVKVVISASKPSIAVYPNPIAGNTVHLSFINQPKGLYTVRFFNAAMQAVLSRMVRHNGGSSTESIQLHSAFSKGNYLLEITSPDKSRQTWKVVY